MSKYKFSVIIPIYNVERYLEETIESVVNQTIGFEENIQMILVNDGSSDNSESICLKYRDMYPDNVVYIKQKNSGVSSARNNGMKYAEGEYVNFLDSDDKWSSKTFERVYKFFSKHKDEVDIVACKIFFFGAREEEHVLNYKFEGKSEKVIDINKDFNYALINNPTCFIKREAINIYYDTEMKYSEDSVFLNLILLNKCKYGALNSATYYYRKRFEKNSAIDTRTLDPDFYNKIPKKFYGKLQSCSIDKFGKVIPYIQYLLMYDIQWRIKVQIPEGVLSEKEIIEYKDCLRNILKKIDDKIILEQNSIFTEHKLYTLSLKYNTDILSKCNYKNNELYFNDNVIYSFIERKICVINVININKDFIDVCGRINCPLPNQDYKIYYKYNNNELKLLDLITSPHDIKYVMEGELYSTDNFQIKEKLNKEIKNTIHFYIKYKNEEIIPLQLFFSMFGRLSKDRSSHYVKNGYILYKKQEAIVCKRKSLLKSFEIEALYYLKNIYKLKFKQLVYRSIYHILKIFKTKPIWIISDRPKAANDNGMHLFKYLNEQDNLKARVYLAIDKDSKDYEKMEKYGKVLNHNSLIYKMKFLLSDKIISSQADVSVINPFGKSEYYYRDLFRFDFVFLQHGITQNDLSSWLNKYNKNISMFVTVAYDEYNSILNGDYGYDKSVVKLTGFPRYDNLKNHSKNIIAVMPTWRKSLSGLFNNVSGTREYNPAFKESEYFKFYNDLINDKRLIDCMNKHNYKGIFVVHPSHEENYVDFNGNDTFEINSGFADYQDIFKKSNLLLSDYSSVQFDFAYLYKPVIYSQFDKEDFFSTHTCKEGYFDCERDGFGPVTYDYDSTVDAIINYIENDCKMEDKYSKRVDKFYKFHDHNNCERVYKEILALDEN